MNVEAMVKKSLDALTSGGIFHINRIDYDEKNFGNINALLSSNNQVDIRFIKDRGVFWCEVGQAGQWYFIEDVCAFIGVTVLKESNDFINYITEMSDLIRLNIAQIFDVFNTENSKDTQRKIKALATKRAMGMFKQ